MNELLNAIGHSVVQNLGYEEGVVGLSGSRRHSQHARHDPQNPSGNLDMGARLVADRATCPPPLACREDRPNPVGVIDMAITFKSVGHFFAKAFSAIAKEIPAIQKTETTVEAVTAAAGGSAVIPLESAAYAVLGGIAAAITAGGDATTSKLADAGLDVGAINAVKAVLAQFPNLVSLAKAL